MFPCSTRTFIHQILALCGTRLYLYTDVLGLPDFRCLTYLQQDSIFGKSIPKLSHYDDVVLVLDTLTFPVFTSSLTCSKSRSRNLGSRCVKYQHNTFCSDWNLELTEWNKHIVNFGKSFFEPLVYIHKVHSGAGQLPSSDYFQNQTEKMTLQNWHSDPTLDLHPAPERTAGQQVCQSSKE